MNNHSIGTIIKNIRKEHNLSQQQLSDILGLNNSTISKWEHDLITPDITYLKIISEKFNIPLEKLLEGETKAEKKSKKDFVYKTIIFIESLLIIIFLIQWWNNRDLVFYSLSSTNNQLIIEGTSISNNDNIYLRINKIEYMDEKAGTADLLIPDIVTIKINIDNKTVENKFIENEDQQELAEILNNIDITIKDKIPKNYKITMELTIHEKDNVSHITTNINQDYIIK